MLRREPQEPPHESEKTLQDSLGIVLEGLTHITGPNQEKCRTLLIDNLEKIKTAPGSRHNHQAWPGGYLDHLADTFELAAHLIQFKPERGRPFTLSDVYLVMFLHDIEKPFAYEIDSDGRVIVRPELSDKPAKKAFRAELVRRYGLELSDDHHNALRYVESVPDDEYDPSDRTMGELAAFCHVLDTFSARVDHSNPRSS